MSYNTKNYTEQGGEKTVIGGTLKFEEGAKVETITAGEIEASTATSVAQLKDDFNTFLKKAGYIALDDWAVTIPTGITYANMATAETAANSNAVTVTLTDNVIKVATGGAVEDELSLADHGEGWGEHYWLGFGIRTGLDSDAGVVFTQLTGMEAGKEPTAVTLTAADDDEAKSVGLANAGDIILYIKAETVRDNGGLTFKLGYSAHKSLVYTVVIDETESD